MVLMKTKRDFRFFARPHGLFNRIKPAQEASSLVLRDTGLPLPSTRIDTDVPGRVVRGAARIGHVLRMRNVTQILQTVIRWIPIDMVNHVRLFAMGHLPNHPVRLVVDSKDRTVKAASIAGRECAPSSVLTVPPAALDSRCKMLRRTRSPKQMADLRVINQQVAEKLGIRQFLGSHVNLYNRFRGQGRALLTQRFRPASYGRVTVCSQAIRGLA